jgi:hypothetical protein
MDFEAFSVWLRQEYIEKGILASQMDDLLGQRRLFDAEREFIESEFRMHVVGYVADERQVTDSTMELLERVIERFPGRMVYFEPIGYSLFG